MPGKPPAPGRSTDLDYSRARAYPFINERISNKISYVINFGIDDSGKSMLSITCFK